MSRLGSGVNSRGRLIYTCRSCNANSRNGAWLDALVVEHVVDRLSRDDALELTQPEPRDDLDEIRARVGRCVRGWIPWRSSSPMASSAPAQIKTMTQAHQRAAGRDRRGAPGRQTTRVYDGVIGAEDVDTAFDGLDLDRKRAIIDALLEITVRPSGRCGRVFKREDVDVVYRGR